MGYGSLTSGLGLGTLLPGVTRARAVRLEVGRHFAKPVQRGACLAMNLEPLPRATLHARPLDLEQDSPQGGGCEALLIEVDPSQGVLAAKREGFPAACWDALSGMGPCLASTLRGLAHAAEDDVLAYRSLLLERSGFQGEQTHYVPHPVEVEGEPAVVFVAPEPGRTGRPGLRSALQTVDVRPALLSGLPASFARAYPGTTRRRSSATSSSACSPGFTD